MRLKSVLSILMGCLLIINIGYISSGSIEALNPPKFEKIQQEWRFNDDDAKDLGTVVEMLEIYEYPTSIPPYEDENCTAKISESISTKIFEKTQDLSTTTQGNEKFPPGYTTKPTPVKKLTTKPSKIKGFKVLKNNIMKLAKKKATKPTKKYEILEQKSAVSSTTARIDKITTVSVASGNNWDDDQQFFSKLFKDDMVGNPGLLGNHNDALGKSTRRFAIQQSTIGPLLEDAIKTSRSFSKNSKINEGKIVSSIEPIVLEDVIKSNDGLGKKSRIDEEKIETSTSDLTTTFMNIKNFPDFANFTLFPDFPNFTDLTSTNFADLTNSTSRSFTKFMDLENSTDFPSMKSTISSISTSKLLDVITKNVISKKKSLKKAGFNSNLLHKHEDRLLQEENRFQKLDGNPFWKLAWKPLGKFDVHDKKGAHINSLLKDTHFKYKEFPKLMANNIFG